MDFVVDGFPFLLIHAPYPTSRELVDYRLLDAVFSAPITHDSFYHERVSVQAVVHLIQSI
jgi:hypothetical protein